MTSLFCREIAPELQTQNYVHYSGKLKEWMSQVSFLTMAISGLWNSCLKTAAHTSSWNMNCGRKGGFLPASRLTQNYGNGQLPWHAVVRPWKSHAPTRCTKVPRKREQDGSTWLSNYAHMRTRGSVGAKEERAKETEKSGTKRRACGCSIHA